MRKCIGALAAAVLVCSPALAQQGADTNLIALACHQAQGGEVQLNIDDMVKAKPGEQRWLDVKNRSDALILVLTGSRELRLLDRGEETAAVPCSDQFEYNGQFRCVALLHDKNEQTSITVREYSDKRGASVTATRQNFEQGRVSVTALECQQIPLATLNALDG